MLERHAAIVADAATHAVDPVGQRRAGAGVAKVDPVRSHFEVAAGEGLLEPLLARGVVHVLERRPAFVAAVGDCVLAALQNDRGQRFGVAGELHLEVQPRGAAHDRDEAIRSAVGHRPALAHQLLLGDTADRDPPLTAVGQGQLHATLAIRDGSEQVARALHVEGVGLARREAPDLLTRDRSAEPIDDLPTQLDLLAQLHVQARALLALELDGTGPVGVAGVRHGDGVRAWGER